MDPLTLLVGPFVSICSALIHVQGGKEPSTPDSTKHDGGDKEKRMPKARKDKDGDRLHAEGPPPISATEKAKVKEQEEVLKAPAAEPMIVVDKPDNDGKTPAHSPAAPKTPEVEKRTLDVREGERSSSPVASGSRRKLSGAAGTPPRKASPNLEKKEVKDPLQIKIIEQEDEDSEEEEDDSSDDDDASPAGTPKDGKAVDKGKDVDGWTIPAAKNKERLPLTNGDVSRSAPELQRLAPEDDDGHIEYKLKLVNISDERFEHLLSQMQWRLSEGQGKAIYRLGVTDSGEQVGLPVVELDASIETVKKMATQLKADVHLISRKQGVQGETAELLVEKRLQEDGVFSEVRVAVVGNVDSGKSTLLGVLSKGILDNGRGLARLNVFRHKHEVETGRTSDISKEILGFNDAAQPVNYSPVKTPTWPEICEHSSKVVMFMDLAGHEKYLKTTVFGLTGNYPDYTMMIVGSNMGVVGMTKEHYQLTLALKIPVFMVVTKIDICPPNVLEETMSVLTKMLKAPGSMKMPVIVKTREQAIFAAKNFTSERLVPIFQLSSVTGECLDVLRYFLYLLPSTKDWDALLKEPVEFFLDNTFSITGVGTVVSGTLMRGLVKVNQNLLIGPDEFGKFQPVQIKGIHTNRLPVKFVRAGQSASFALKKFKRKELRKGMAIVDAALNPQACWEFDAEILIITHSTTITKNYEAVIHCGCTRQTAKIVSMENEVLRSGHRATVRFRYKQLPEYLKVGERLIFREGKTKGIGRVAKIHPIESTEQKQS